MCSLEYSEQHGVTDSMFYDSEIISYMKLNRWESINAFLNSLKSHSWSPGLFFCHFIVTDVCDYKHYPGAQRVNLINALIVKRKRKKKEKGFTARVSV